MRKKPACTVCDGTIHRLKNNPPAPGENVADFKARLAAMLRPGQPVGGAKRSHPSLVRGPGDVGFRQVSTTPTGGAQAQQTDNQQGGTMPITPRGLGPPAAVSDGTLADELLEAAEMVAGLANRTKLTNHARLLRHIHGKLSDLYERLDKEA